ncbi:MAG: putative DNA binding domain-containing protein [Fibrella sp.]|nr:putative DNA binding domain-containing protein [Armatimonadota bacterium]
MAQKLNVGRTRDSLQDFAFQKVFVDELGWNHPASHKTGASDPAFSAVPIAELSGVVVAEVTANDGAIPDAKTRAAFHKEFARTHHENLLIFLDKDRTQSLWYWVKRDGTKTFPRDHHFVKGQPGDLFLAKLTGMVVDISELDSDGNLPVTEVAKRLQSALDVEKVTKKFFGEFKTAHEILLADFVTGIANQRDKKWYVSVLLNRLMFVYFLQGKGFLPHPRYLQVKLAESKARGADLFYSEFLNALFFEGFALPKEKRTAEAAALIGNIKYLNGGLFLKHRIEIENPDIQVPDAAFDALLRDDAEPRGLFARYSWNLDDTPGGKDDEMAPGTLGYIFEKYINQKEFGAYYTREEITEYLCEQTIHRLILDKVTRVAIPGVAPARHFDTIGDMLLGMDADLCKMLLHEVLPRLTLLDPACGSGAFLVAAMKTLVNVYSAVIGRIAFLGDRALTDWKTRTEKAHPSLGYFIKREIIKNNLFGVDINPEAVEIARLRLFLALIASAQTVDDLEPLPNIDFNLLPGNALIGLLRVTADDFDKTAALGEKTFGELVREKDIAVAAYKNASGITDNVQSLRDAVDSLRDAALVRLDTVLLKTFTGMGIRHERATWDDAKGAEGKPVKSALVAGHIAALTPFHWGYEFADVLNTREGFDAIITNPPWEVFQTDEKEFFQTYVPTIKKNKLRIEDWKKQQSEILKDEDIRKAWLDYASRFPHVSAFFKQSPQYKNQISIVNGKNAGSKINLYTYFVEQCHNLLRTGGYCGIVIPSGIYSDLGTKQLRELLFSANRVTNVFGLSNERYIFENVDHRFKLCFLTFQKGGITEQFNAAFRVHPAEAIRKDQLAWFFHAKDEHMTIPVATIRAASPDSLSIMEVKDKRDFSIADKFSRFPRLGEKVEGTWNMVLTSGFNMTTGSHLFHTAPAPGRLPLFQGNMIHQFTHTFAQPKYWVVETEGRRALLGSKRKDEGQTLEYQCYKLAVRSVSSSTNERTLVSSIIPANNFYGNSLNATNSPTDLKDLLYICAVVNSVVADYALRKMVAANVNMFYVYQVPVPRIKATDAAYKALMERAARLICTTPEFDDLARAVNLLTVAPPAFADRATLRAEIDGIVAHLYGLSEDEFAYILTTFPLITAPVKTAALEAYRAIERGEIVRMGDDPATAALREMIAAWENDTVECKIAARWNEKTGRPDDTMKDNIVQAVASFLNTAGGTLLIGVRKDATIAGLADDFVAVNAQNPGTDTYELWLRNAVGDRIGKQFADLWRVRFVTIDGVQVCRVEVFPAPAPAYLDGDFYIRDGGKKQKMKVAEAAPYIQRKFYDKKRGSGTNVANDAEIDYLRGGDGLFSTQTKSGL